jgi:hypothetical protein
LTTRQGMPGGAVSSTTDSGAVGPVRPAPTRAPSSRRARPLRPKRRTGRPAAGSRGRDAHTGPAYRPKSCRATRTLMRRHRVTDAAPCDGLENARMLDHDIDELGTHRDVADRGRIHARGGLQARRRNRARGIECSWSARSSSSKRRPSLDRKAVGGEQVVLIHEMRGGWVSGSLSATAPPGSTIRHPGWGRGDGGALLTGRGLTGCAWCRNLPRSATRRRLNYAGVDAPGGFLNCVPGVRVTPLVAPVMDIRAIGTLPRPR